MYLTLLPEAWVVIHQAAEPRAWCGASWGDRSHAPAPGRTHEGSTHA